MKTKHIIKTVGLISALSFSSIALISCDDDDTPTASNGSGDNNNGSSSNGGNTTSGTPQSLANTSNSDVSVGGVFLADVGDGTYQFTITSITSTQSPVTGLGNVEVRFGNSTRTENGLSFSYNNGELVVTDNRTSDSDVTTTIRSLTGPGGAAEAEFNAVINSNDPSQEESLIDQLVEALNSAPGVVGSFILDYVGSDDVFVVRDLTMNDVVEVGGTAIDGNTSSTLSVSSRRVQYNDSANITYTNP